LGITTPEQLQEFLAREEQYQRAHRRKKFFLDRFPDTPEERERLRTEFGMTETQLTKLSRVWDPPPCSPEFRYLMRGPAPRDSGVFVTKSQGWKGWINRLVDIHALDGSQVKFRYRDLPADWVPIERLKAQRIRWWRHKAKTDPRHYRLVEMIKWERPNAYIVPGRRTRWRKWKTKVVHPPRERVRVLVGIGPSRRHRILDILEWLDDPNR